jgi:3-hydroxyacyl-[acyl-carrier-protein] dehydratase
MTNTLNEALKGSAIGKIEPSDTPGWFVKSFCFGPEFLGFRGHFPGYPIVPAFVQVLMSLVCMEELKNVALEMSALDNAKFQRELKPGVVITVEWRELPDRPYLTFQVRIKDGKETASSFLITCKEKKGQSN